MSLMGNGKGLHIFKPILINHSCLRDSEEIGSPATRMSQGVQAVDFGIGW